MRERKYRGISLDTGKWIYGYGVVVNTAEDVALIINQTSNNLLQHNGVDTKTVTDYTGLKDRLSQEIYEGDIISTPKGICPVTFESGCFYAITVSKYRLGGWETDSIEIIGNIFENSELLKITKNQ